MSALLPFVLSMFVSGCGHTSRNVQMAYYGPRPVDFQGEVEQPKPGHRQLPKDRRRRGASEPPKVRPAGPIASRTTTSAATSRPIDEHGARADRRVDAEPREPRAKTWIPERLPLHYYPGGWR